MEDFVKEQWVELIDFSSMKAEKSVFKGISDSKRESDLLIKFKLKKKKPEKLYIFILLEFQSKAEPMMLRLLEYLGRIYKKQKAEGKTLYPVVPVVIYNGSGKWSEKNNFIEHFSLSSNELNKYIPNFKYLLIDIANFGDELGVVNTIKISSERRGQKRRKGDFQIKVTGLPSKRSARLYISQ